MSSNPNPGSPAFKTIVVAIDYSDDALTALQVAEERFGHAGATLVLVHAIDSSDTVQEHSTLHSQVVETLAVDAKRRLDLLARSHKERWLDVQTFAELGRPTEVILSAARTVHADLVVMGSHGGRSLKRTLFGDTTYQVARKLDCSVFVLRLPPAS